MGIITTQEVVTWEQAQEWLATLEQAEQYGFRQRIRRDGNVARYANDMLSGVYRQDTGESIKFHELGFLVDGQHRLTSQVRAKVTLVWSVTRGLSDEAVKVLDIGRPRNVNDVFRMKGISNTTQLTTTIRKMWVLAGGNTKEGLSPPIAEDILSVHPKVEESVKRAGSIRTHIAPLCNFAAVHYIAANIQNKSSLADEYIHLIAFGKQPDGKFPNSSNNAAIRLREHLLRTRASQEGKQVRYLSDVYMKYAVYGWNLFSDGREVRQIALPDEVKMDSWDMDTCLGKPIIRKKVHRGKRKTT